MQLLIDDMSERPRCPSRTADVLRSGLTARIASTGLAGDVLEPSQQVRAGLGILSIAVTVFLAAGIAIWSQLTIGWQWSAPSAPAKKAGMFVMSGTLLGFAVLAILVGIPLIFTIFRELVSGRRRNLVFPLVLSGVGAGVLIIGSVHFGHGWPGTGGHPWAGRDVVPGAVARFWWAATLWVTSYWAHPDALASFPVSEVGWMVASPAALFATLFGVAKMLRRLPLSSRILRYESWLASAASVVMACFLAGAGSWVISGGPAPRGLFRVGAIDFIGIVAMAGALMVAFRAAQRVRSARPARTAVR